MHILKKYLGPGMLASLCTTSFSACSDYDANTISKELNIQAPQSAAQSASIMYRHDITADKHQYACFYKATAHQKYDIEHMKGTERINSQGFPLFRSTDIDKSITALNEFFTSHSKKVTIYYNEHEYKNYPKVLSAVQYFAPVLDPDFSKLFDGQILNIDTEIGSEKAKAIFEKIHKNIKYQNIYVTLINIEQEIEKIFLASQFDVDSIEHKKYSGELCDNKDITQSAVQKSSVFPETKTCEVKQLSMVLFKHLLKNMDISEQQATQFIDKKIKFYKVEVPKFLSDQDIFFPTKAPTCPMHHPRITKLAYDFMTNSDGSPNPTLRPCTFGGTVVGEQYFVGQCKMLPIHKCHIDAFTQAEIFETYQDASDIIDKNIGHPHKFNPGTIGHGGLTKCEDVKIVGNMHHLKIK